MNENIAVTTIEIENKIHEIKSCITSEYKENEFLGLHIGLPGIALFYFYYAKHFKSDEAQNAGNEVLKLIRDKIISEQHVSTICSGLSGACWVYDHLSVNNMINIDTDEFLSDLDEYFYGEMIKEFQNNYYDFLHGASGYAFYFLNRYNSTKLFKERYVEYLRKYLKEIRLMASFQGNEIYWESYLKKEPEMRGVNFSLSHGMPSLISILCDMSKIKELKEDCLEIISGAVTFIKNNPLNDKHAVSAYPSWIDKNSDTQVSSRLAWCYGDLGIALCFLKASRVLNDQDLEKEAMSILNFSSKRKKQSETKVNDSAICHGAFGVAQIFNYVSKEYNTKEFDESIDFWVKTGMNFLTHDDYAGFRFWYGNEKGWTKEISLLEGITGVGLCLIDYLSKDKNNWDSCLLIS